jgi:hypothetical protein
MWQQQPPNLAAHVPYQNQKKMENYSLPASLLLHFA